MVLSRKTRFTPTHRTPLNVQCLVNQLSHVLLHASHLPRTDNARLFLHPADRTGKRQLKGAPGGILRGQRG